MGTALPSTRALAADLEVSRGVVVRAYAQLAAEGYIEPRQNAAPLVAAVGQEPEEVAEPDVPLVGVRFNLRPDLPDLGLFPRREWVAATREALERAADHDLAYGEPFGATRLRAQLAPFLARTRGVAATAGRTSVLAGSSQALFVLASLLRGSGARRIAVEDPGHRWRTRAIAATGLEVVHVPVDGDGLRVEDLPDAAAVVVSPDHHFPTGAALSPQRRRDLLEWAARGNRLVIEHDYDGHFRYDRAPTGALQGLAPELVAYVGSASALLAPTLRLGWAVVPSRLVVPVANEVFRTAVASPRLAQLALAELIERGHLDRQLRKVRALYRRRREVLCSAFGPAVRGAPAGLYVAVELPEGTSEAAVLEAARHRSFALDGVNEHTSRRLPAGLVLGFAAEPEPTLRHAAEQLTELVERLPR